METPSHRLRPFVIVVNESMCANYIKLVTTKLRAPDRGYLRELTLLQLLIGTELKKHRVTNTFTTVRPRDAHTLFGRTFSEPQETLHVPFVRFRKLCSKAAICAICGLGFLGESIQYGVADIDQENPHLGQIKVSVHVFQRSARQIPECARCLSSGGTGSHDNEIQCPLLFARISRRQVSLRSE